jgi:hypothetical protein
MMSVRNTGKLEGVILIGVHCEHLCPCHSETPLIDANKKRKKRNVCTDA